MKTPHDLVAQAKAQIKEISIAEAPARIQEADALVDVREESEYAAGHLPGAMHASRGMLEFKMAGHPSLSNRDAKIVLYCKTSGRAALAAQALQSMGYVNVVSIAGGYDAWVQAGHPTSKPDVPSFE